MERALVLLAVVALTAAVTAWWRARDGRVRVLAPAPTPRAADGPTEDHPWDGLPAEAADVVAAIGLETPFALVEFTAPDCAPCAAAKLVLDEAVAARPAVTVAQLDVAEALDLARAHRVMRAPTTLLVSADGHLLGRVSGVPRRDELEDLLDATADGPRPSVHAAQ